MWVGMVYRPAPSYMELASETKRGRRIFSNFAPGTVIRVDVSQFCPKSQLNY